MSLLKNGSVQQHFIRHPLKMKRKLTVSSKIISYPKIFSSNYDGTTDKTLFVELNR
jgi:hypothetical protein